jgi:hypothetical protein
MAVHEISADGTAVTEACRDIPVVHQAEVLVIGAGVAGTAAARTGARTLVVERGGFAGGTGTAGLMSLYTLPYEHVHGVCRDLVDAMAAEGGAVRGPVVPFDPESFKRVALAKFQDAGVSLLFYTWTVDAITADGRVRGVIVENKSGRQAILADVIVDASGDGDVAVAAGAQWVSGREDDGKMRPMSIVFRMGPVDIDAIAHYRAENPTEFSPDPGHNVLDPELCIVRLDGFFSVMRSGRDRGLVDANTHYLRLYGIAAGNGDLYVNSSRVYGVDGTDAADLTRAQAEAMAQNQALAAFLRAEIPGFADAQVRETAVGIGVRETRRIVGDYTLGIDDCDAGRRFPDAVATAIAHMVPGVEIHSPDAGEGDVADPYVAGLVLPFREFSVPLGCLLPRGLDGIVVAGRCIATTHEADGWTRNQPVMMQIGEGAGAVAAMAALDGVLPRDVDIARVQGSLKQHGAHLRLPE